MLFLANFITAMTGFAAPGPDENAAATCADRRARVVDLADVPRDEHYVDIATFRDYRALIARFDPDLVMQRTDAAMPDGDWVDYFDVSQARTPFDLAVEVFFQRLSGCDGFRFVAITDSAGVVLKRIEIAAGTKSLPAVLWQNDTATEELSDDFEWREAA